jgi:phage-related minor tail protein
MSYRQNYHFTLTIRGSVNASYPASQNGGSHTISYTHTEPIDVDVLVDTNPFDHSVGACDEQIGMLKGAVIAMKAAQVQSIKDSSHEVGKHVTDGFFSLVSSEITQQIADLLNQVNSKFALMIEQKKAAENILQVMERDYSRLAGHYRDLFRNLDEELQRRIQALDSNSFNLSGEIMHKLLFQSSLSQATTYAIEAGEIGNTQMMIASSVIRNKVGTLLGAAHSHIMEDRKLSQKLVDVLENQKLSEQTDLYLPVIIVEKDQLQSTTAETEYLTPDDAAPKLKERVHKAIVDKTKSMKWGQNKGPDHKLIEQEYLKLVNDTYGSRTGEDINRIKNMMFSLWQASPAAVPISN